MVPVSEPLIGDNVLPLVRECIESGWISSEGSFIQDFESKWARYCGAAHGVAVANGTCALQVAVRALALEPGAEIILPSFTIISCIIAILEAGCVPVLVDVEPDTWNVDLERVTDTKELTGGAARRCLLPQHLQRSHSR